jgi:8-amino-7-oxononanoate synthase
LVTLKERYGALLMIDEAHSGGLFGDDGQGLTHYFGLSARVDIQMGTFSKAYGRFGAYVACDSLIRDYLLNKSRAFIYTTALPPLLVAAIRENWLRAQAECWRRKRVLALASAFRAGLAERGFDTGGSECQIVPLIVGDNARAVRLAKQLQERGVLAVAIRPPTVPQGSARIRFSWTAAHCEADVQTVLAAIDDCADADDVYGENNE